MVSLQHIISKRGRFRSPPVDCLIMCYPCHHQDHYWINNFMQKYAAQMSKPQFLSAREKRLQSPNLCHSFTMVLQFARETRFAFQKLLHLHQFIQAGRWQAREFSALFDPKPIHSYWMSTPQFKKEKISCHCPNLIHSSKFPSVKEKRI